MNPLWFVLPALVLLLVAAVRSARRQHLARLRATWGMKWQTWWISCSSLLLPALFGPTNNVTGVQSMVSGSTPADGPCSKVIVSITASRFCRLQLEGFVRRRSGAPKWTCEGRPRLHPAPDLAGQRVASRVFRNHSIVSRAPECVCRSVISRAKVDPRSRGIMILGTSLAATPEALGHTTRLTAPGGTVAVLPGRERTHLC